MGPPTCCLCRRAPAELTLEHVPPQSTGNRGRVRVQTYGTRTDNTSVANGLSARVLCARCNSTMGSRVGTSYAEFVRQVRRSGNVRLPKRRVFVLAEDVYPQRVVRQLYLTFLSISRPEALKDPDRYEGLREFVRFDDRALPDNAPQLALYFNRSATFRVAPMSALLSLRPGWRWFGSEVAHPGLGVIYSVPDDNPERPPPPLLAEAVDVTAWATAGYRERRTVRLELPAWRVEHPHPLAFGRPSQAERWHEEQHVVWALNQDDESDDILKASGSVLWKGR